MTPALAAFIAPAQPEAALWRTVATLALVTALTAAGTFAILLIIDRFQLLDVTETFSTRAGAFLLLSSFIVWWGAIWATLRLLHRRGFATLFGPRRPGRWRRFALGFVVATAANLIAVAPIAVLFGAPEASGAQFGEWALYALAALPLVLIQTGAEEAIFRGYLLQQLAARFRSPAIWAVAPSLLFGVLHIDPELPGAGLAAIAAAACAGLVFTAITAATGDLFAAWGMHFGVNVTAFLLVAPYGHVDGLALYIWPESFDLNAMALGDAALWTALLLFFLALIRARRSA